MQRMVCNLEGKRVLRNYFIWEGGADIMLDLYGRGVRT
jgi:hypothetical protein